MFSTVPAHGKDDLAGRTAGLLLKIAPVAVRFGQVVGRILPVTRPMSRPPLLELVNARGADGIKAGLALLSQWFAAPVKVRHDGIPALVLCRKKLVAGDISVIRPVPGYVRPAKKGILPVYGYPAGILCAGEIDLVAQPTTQLVIATCTCTGIELNPAILSTGSVFRCLQGVLLRQVNGEVVHAGNNTSRDR